MLRKAKALLLPFYCDGYDEGIFLRHLQQVTDFIKACDVDGKPHYMNAIAGWSQYDAAITEPVVSEIKLTKGWTETKSSDTRSAGRTYVEKVNIEDEECERIVWKSMTKFPERENIEFKEAEPCIITMEMIEESLEKYASKYQRR